MDNIIESINDTIIQEINDDLTESSNSLLREVDDINTRFSSKGYDITGTTYRYASGDSYWTSKYEYYLDTGGLERAIDASLEDQAEIFADIARDSSDFLNDNFNDLKEEISFQSNTIERNQINAAQMMNDNFRELNQTIIDNSIDSNAIADAIEDSSFNTMTGLEKLGYTIKNASLDTAEFIHDSIGDLVENWDTIWRETIDTVDTFLDEYGDVFGFWFNEFLELLKLLFSFNEEDLDDIIKIIYEKLRDFSTSFSC